ncbi:MAG: CHASE2 domain-containing protein [Leptolyngbyaceae cyanobacterium RM2_2_4]|nr:CHASE2 domain-containing protein [Leptolyngbyaceae cyanobacterium SM1_4_3]NJN90410.1 CHASE2 domain-containing protein [Leptolyngbyaceae cyanobacterium SL_5_14]NJO48750.1 CHASE2 domain-containing protein [Leptolyngbyaceae cyanobacterium RM2_2_4]
MLGTLLGGRYKLITALGAGGFGQTYLAEDIQQPGGLRCVIKHFKPASRDSKFLEVARRLFDTEVGALDKLGQHDQIPELLGFFEENREFYLVQEFIDGHPLSEEISRASRLNEAEVVALLRDVLGVLEFIHKNQVIHRDIKPSNLIRRRQDGKIILIDFGAVKEIRTQIQGESGQTGFTVGIGTQGYTPGEQLLGKPRFSSDIYALGVTAIQAITGLQPSQLPEDPETSELIWEDYANLSPGLTFVLSQMVRHHFSKRYQSASEVLWALDRLSELPTDLTSTPQALLPSLLLPEAMLRQTKLVPSETLRQRVKSGLKVVAIATLAVTSMVLGGRQMGWLQAPEIAAFDQMTRLRQDAPPDPRLLVVAITEADLQALGRPTPSDASVTQVLQTLERYQPRVIGLDLYRELPQEPGHRELLQLLQQSDRIIAITKLGNSEADYIPPPPGVPAERVGFNDFAIDNDDVIRRHLLIGNNEQGVFYSFGLRLAFKYLAAENIEPRPSEANPDNMQLGETVFLPLEPTAGGYQRVDWGGYQVMLNYRAAANVARQVSFTDVLNGRIEPDWVRDKIVLIGTTAPSGKDLFSTPYSAVRQTDYRMPGVIVHAQMVSQILSAAMEGQQPFWYWPDWLEMVWVAGWAIAGGCVAWMIRHPVGLGASTAVLLIGLSGSTLLIFILGGWVPVATPAITLLAVTSVVTIYRTYKPQPSLIQTKVMWQTEQTRTLPRP